VIIQLINQLRFWVSQRCADCGGLIGQDSGPPDGWQLEDSRTVCHACCCADFRRHIDQTMGTH
jgi:hypothetical protein